MERRQEEWTSAIRLYKKELIRAQRKNHSQLKRLQNHLKTLNFVKNVIRSTINKEIRETEAKIKDKQEDVEAHDTLIIQAEDGSLNRCPTQNVMD